jgi:hypothetical protein
MSDMASATNGTPRNMPSSPANRAPRGQQRASSRPLGPPSESNTPGAFTDDLDAMAIDADDEVVGNRVRPRDPTNNVIPKISDALGESVRETFQHFLET